MRAVLLILILLPVQESDISRWIEDLSHEDVARRDYAQSALLKAGEKALPGMKKALEGRTGEPAVRLRAVIEEIERPIREKSHDEAERRRVLELLSFDDGDLKLGDVLDAIEKNTKYKLASEVDKGRVVRVGGRDQPLRRVLDRIEEQLDLTVNAETFAAQDPVTQKWETHSRLSVKAGRPARPPRILIAGNTFAFKRRAYRVDDKLLGWIVEEPQVQRYDLLPVSIDVVGTDGTRHELELCGRCSPGRILAKVPKDEELRVRIRGVLQWESTYVLDVADPERPQTFRVGPYTSRYEFPKVRVTAQDPIESRHFANARLVGVLKPGREAEEVVRYGGRFGSRKAKPKGWCQCAEGPSPMEPLTSNLIVEREFSSDISNPASDIASMKIRFNKVLLEHFSGESKLPIE